MPFQLLESRQLQRQEAVTPCLKPREGGSKWRSHLSDRPDFRQPSSRDFVSVFGSCKLSINLILSMARSERSRAMRKMDMYMLTTTIQNLEDFMSKVLWGVVVSPLASSEDGGVMADGVESVEGIV